MAGPKAQTTGYWYYLGLHFGLALAIDGLKVIRGGDRAAFVGNQTTSGRISINQPNLWGGEKSEGGIVGDFDLMMGDATQMPNDYLASKQTGPQPAYRGVCTGVFRGGKIGANNPYPKPWGFRVWRALKGWQNDTPWYPEKALITLAGGQIHAMNPAHILYESITNSDWGQGEPTALINDASFRAAADKLYAEGFGLCIQYDAQYPVEDFQKKIVDYIAAAMTQSRVDGQYYLDLIRNDYVFADLPIIAEADIIDAVYEPSTLVDAVNQIIVEWFDPITRTNHSTAPIQALGNIQAQGAVISETDTLRGLPTEDLAIRVGKRNLDAKAKALSRLTLTVNRKHYDRRLGKPVRVQLSSDGIGDVVFRIGEMDWGTLTDSKIKMIMVQDVFSLPASVYVQPHTGGYVAADRAPHPAPYQQAIEAPYIEVAQALSTAELAALAADAGFLVAMGTRPAGLALNYQLVTKTGGESFAEHGLGDWCPTGLLSAALDRIATSIALLSYADLDRVVVGTSALIGNEIVRVDAIDAVAGTATLARGCADTVPALHSMGDRVWFYDQFAASDQREYVAAEVVAAKLLTRTGTDQLDPSLAPEQDVTMVGRQSRPYPPANVVINAAAWPTTVTGAMTIAWAHRDRILQADQLVGWGAASIGPEPGTRYALRFLDASNVLLVAKLDIDGTSAAAVLNYTGNVTMQLYAITNNGESLQRVSHVFAYTPPAGTVSSSITASTYTPTGYVLDGGGP
jgi:hypothetical protein